MPDICDEPLKYWIDVTSGYRTMGVGHDISSATRKVPLAYYNQYFKNVFKEAFLYLPSERAIGEMTEVVFYEHRKFGLLQPSKCNFNMDKVKTCQYIAHTGTSGN